MWAIRKNSMGYTTELSFQSKPYYKGRLFKKSLSFCVGMRKGCPLYPWAIILLSCCVYWDGASIIALVIIMIS